MALRIPRSLRRSGVSRSTVIAWRRHFVIDGVAAVGKVRKGRGRKPTIPQEKIEQIVHDTQHTKPPDGATHWSVRSMAKHSGVSKSKISQIWRARGLKPHLIKTFKLSNDPRFEEKLSDVIQLYRDPPEGSVVLCFDEKTQIQALDRTQPTLPMKKGRAGTMTHDYKRNGTTTLFAALDMASGELIGRCYPKHRHQEFLDFLALIDRTVAKGLQIHLVLDNYSAHKHANVKTWLAAHPRFHLHFTPTSSSWSNMVERFFGAITTKMIRRSVFRSVKELITAIMTYIEISNKDPQPYRWTKTVEEILVKVRRGRLALELQLARVA